MFGDLFKNRVAAKLFINTTCSQWLQSVTKTMLKWELCLITMLLNQYVFYFAYLFFKKLYLSLFTTDKQNNLILKLHHLFLSWNIRDYYWEITQIWKTKKHTSLLIAEWLSFLHNLREKRKISYDKFHLFSLKRHKFDSTTMLAKVIF